MNTKPTTALAAVAIAMVATSAPIRNDLGADGEKYTTDWVPTAADYIQDGLVCLFDGIENVGWGQHDSESLEWVDLAGGLVIPTLGFDDKSATMGIVAVTDEELLSVLESPNVTVEFLTVFGVAPYSSRIGNLVLDPVAMYWGFANYRWGTLENRNTGFRYLYGTARFLPFPYTADDIWTVRWTMTRNGKTCRVYYDNGTDWARVSYTITEPSESATALRFRRSGNPQVYALRIYGRTLTEDEVGYNYIVDKIRFGL